MEKLQDEKLKKILMELAEMLQEVYRDKLKEVILSGSVARGTATDDSENQIRNAEEFIMRVENFLNA